MTTNSVRAGTAQRPLTHRLLAADAMQDVCLRLLSKDVPHDVAEKPDRLRVYLRGAFRRRLIDQLRREMRHAHVALEDPPCPAPQKVERDERAVRVHSVLTAMSADGDHKAAELLNLRFLDGLSPAQIALRLGLDARAVSARLQRAIRKFRTAWIAGGGACSD